MDVNVFSSDEEGLTNWWIYFVKLKEKGIYHQPNYVKLLEKHYFKDSEAKLFIYGDEKDFYYYPYFKQNIGKLIHSENDPSFSSYFDISSSWYYGGPLISSQQAERKFSIKHFIKSFNQYCINSNIITRFDRLDPNLKNHLLFEKKDTGLKKNRNTVYVDLSKKKKILWQELHCSVRRNIKKALINNIKIINCHTQKNISLFWKIYNSEMIRKNAPNRLRFSYEFFENLFSILPANFELLLVKYGNKIIGGFIIAHNKVIAHHFLAASLPEYWDMRINDLLYYSVILFTKDMGCKIFDFQGGREGVFRFKSKFSPLRSEFITYSAIYNQEIYNSLKEMMKNQGSNKNYFPLYRFANS